MANTGIVLDIDKENYTEADFMSKRFVNSEVRNRAYINVLGAELFIRFLTDNGIKTDDIISMHSISKIVENLDIADVILPNIHIDVRTIFDEDKIFVPKSHFELEITPDIYVVLKLSKNLKDAEILGYFKPSQINKKQANEKYYFVKKETLIPAKMLLDKINQYGETRDSKLDNAEFLRGRVLSVAYSDNNLEIDEQKEFLKLMLTDSMLRDSVAEFDNFEVLSSQVALVLQERLEVKKQNEEKSVPGIVALTTEEILKEGVNAVVEEQKSKVEEVFDKVNDVADVVTTSAEIVDTVADSIVPLSVNEEEKIHDIEILDSDKVKEEAESIAEEDLTTKPEGLSEDVQTNSPEDVNNVPDEDEISPNTDIDTLKTEDIVEGSEIQSHTDEQTVENIEDNLPQLSEELVIDEIGEDLTLDNDDIDNSVIAEQTYFQKEQADIISNDETSISNSKNEEETTEDIEITEPETVDNSNTNLADSDLAIEDFDESLTLDNDISLSEVDDLPVLEGNEQKQETEQDDFSIVEDENLSVDESVSTLSDFETDKTDENLEISDVQKLDNIDEPEISIQDDVELLVDEPLDDANLQIVDDLSIQNTFGDENISENSLNETEIANDVEIEPDKAVSDNAIKMTSVAGGAIDNLVDNQIAKSSENINHKDVSTLGGVEVVGGNEEHTSFVGGLSDAKKQANLIAEAQGLATVTDLSSLEIVEQQKQEDIVHNVVDMEQMATVEVEKPIEESSEIVELDKISGVDSPTKPIEGLDDTSLNVENVETMELPDLNSYTINEDGTTPVENVNWGSEEDIDKGELLDLETTELLPENDAEQVVDTSENLVDSNAFNPQSEDIDFNEIDDIPELGDEDTESSEFRADVDSTELVEKSGQDKNDTEDVQEIEFTDETSINDFLGDEDLSEDSQQAEVAIPNEKDNDEVEDWAEDTGFDSLEDVLPEVNTSSENQDDEITISDEPREYKVYANSSVISSANFTPGEIKIDINTRNLRPEKSENQPINELFQEDSPVNGGEMMKNPGRLSKTSQQQQKGIVVGLGIAGLVVVLGLIFALGFGVSKFLKGQTEETPQPISDNTGDLNTPEPSQSDASTGQVVEMNNNSNALASTTGTKTAKKTDFVEIKKLSWEVPGAVSADVKFQEYFQSAGKSIKSALMTDLLSVTDLAYASEMRVSVTFDQNGTFKDARIVTSSGSTQLDNIVLRTVNQTLSVLKAPHSVGSYENTTAVLKIYL